MDEREFETRAAQALSAIEQALEAAELDADFELKEGGILEIEFADGSRSSSTAMPRRGRSGSPPAPAASIFAGTARLGAIRATARNSSPRYRRWSPSS